MEDPANRFRHWDRPIRTLDWGAQRLEMCPGTLFMVKFVNKMEAEYPFADNLLPVSKLASVLLREDKRGFAAMAWAMLTFAGGSPLAALHAGSGDAIGATLLEQARSDEARRTAVAQALAECSLEELAQRWSAAAAEPDEALLAAVMFALLGRLDDARWNALFAPPAGAVTLGASDDVTLGAVARAAFDDTKLKLRDAAQARVDETGAQVVVMGHTHQRDEWALQGGRYFNPGCWTRYLEAGRGERIRLDELRDESQFPYQLNYVRVEDRSGGAGEPSLQACMVTQAEARPGRG